MEFYLDEKQKKKKRKFLRLKIYGIIAVFLFLFAVFFNFVVNSQFFKIKLIFAVSGDGGEFGAESEELIRNLKIFFASNSKIASLFSSDNILFWRIDIPDFLKNQPIFSDLKISKNYFKREIGVKFTKREKFGVWCQQDNSCFWFDKNGIIFEKAPKSEGEMIYKIQDGSEGRLNIGELILEKRLLENLLKIFEVLEKSELGVKTLYIDNLALEEAEVRPLINSIPQIYFSLRFDPTFTLTAIESFKKNSLGKIQYIDFRVENRVYYKPR